MPLRTLEQNKRFHTLIGQRKLDREDKAALVKECTDGRTTSSSEMTISEMKLAIELLDAEQTTSVRKMRSKIIAVYRDIVNYPEPQDLQQKHWDALNTFLISKFKAPLHKLSYKGLVDATTGIEGWKSSKIRATARCLLK